MSERVRIFDDHLYLFICVIIRFVQRKLKFFLIYSYCISPDCDCFCYCCSLRVRKGFREVEHAARLILEGGYQLDVVFTSRLKRAIRSAWIILQEMDQVYLPVFKSWRLNERMYGALTGLSKTETAEQLGAELVQEWRGSLRSRPPPVSMTSPHWPGRHRKYADLSIDQIPLTESLSDSMDRCGPLWNNKILYELRNGKNVLVVAHANTLRGLVKMIDDISEEDIREVAIPTG